MKMSDRENVNPDRIKTSQVRDEEEAENHANEDDEKNMEQLEPQNLYLEGIITKPGIKSTMIHWMIHKFVLRRDHSETRNPEPGDKF